MLTDPFADFLTRMRNGGMAQLRSVDVFVNNLILDVLQLLLNDGWIASFTVREENSRKIARVILKYNAQKEPLMASIVRLSKPGCRKYVRHREIYPHMSGIGVFILSTPKGVLSGRQAKKEGVGGELLCSISY
ncbi:30S ribosomal protein S8 [Candidatus Similichlamydia epinepheli]|uniref:30S ribosomal protein S8 n=1 Tax=Candidatus Similichlamydia epinepheli TaxID=1903953 RepID=UPI000D3D2F5F|nr:30S ribosomal protein S8 [Candidatus Similichlamydia epinepheli]